MKIETQMFQSRILYIQGAIGEPVAGGDDNSAEMDCPEVVHRNAGAFGAFTVLAGAEEA